MLTLNPASIKNIKKTCGNNSSLSCLPKETKTFGQKAADALTGFCGSWRFIISVLIYIAIWVTLNLIAWNYRWDPWPFIILNLTLSCLAALQAPVILMSQNRRNERDHLNQRYDYLIDRKAEREIQKILKKLEVIEKKLDKES